MKEGSNVGGVNVRAGVLWSGSSVNTNRQR